MKFELTKNFISELNEYIENKVEIKGGIKVPGFYSLSSVKTVKDLINVSSKYLLSGSSKSVIAGENYIEEIKQLNFEIKNI